MAEPVGTAWVRIRAITTGLAGEVNDAVKDIGPKLDPAFEKLGDRAGGSFGQGLRKGLNPKYILPDDFFDKIIPGDSGSKSGQSWGKRFSSALQKFFVGSVHKKGTEDSGKSSGGDFYKGFEKSLKKFDKFKFPKLLVISAVLAPAVAGTFKALSAYIVTLVGLVGNLVEGLAGVGVAAAGSFALLGAAAIPVLLAFKTETPALLKFKDAAKGVGEAWKEVGKSTQQTLLPGLTDALNISKKLIPLFSAWGSAVGTIAGDTAKWAVAMLSTEASQQKLGSFFINGVGALENFKTAFLSIINVVPDLLKAVGPTVEKFSADIRRLAEAFSAMIQRMGADGSLEAAFDRMYEKGRLVFTGLKDFIIGVWNVFKIGSESTQPIMNTFAAWAERWRAWTTSTEGQDKLKRLFDNAIPVFHEINLLMKEILGLLTRPIMEGNNSGIVSTLQMLRTEILPVIVDLVRTLTSNINGEILSKFIQQIGELLKLLSETGALSAVLTTLNIVLSAFITILDTPVLGPVVGRIIAVAGALKALSFLKLAPIIGGLTGLAGGFAGATKEMDGFLAKGVGAHPLMATLGTKFKTLSSSVTEAGGGLSGLATVIKGALAGSFLTASIAGAPLWAILLGIAAAVAGAIIVWKNADTIIQWVKNFWEWTGKLNPVLKWFIRILGILVAIALGPLTMFIGAVIGIKKAFENWDKIKEIIGKVLGAIWGFIKAIPEFVGRIPGMLGDAASALWGWITNAASVVGEKVGEFIAAIPGAFVNLVSTIVGAVAGAAPAVFSWLLNAISQIPHYLGVLVGLILKGLIMIPILIAVGLSKAIPALWGWITEAIPAVLGKLGEFASFLFGGIVDFVGKIPGYLADAAGALWGWLQEAIPMAAQKIAEWATGIWDAITSFVSEIPTKLSVAIPAMGQWVTDSAAALPGKLAEFAQALWDWILNLPSTIVSLLGNVGSWLLDMGPKIITGLFDGLKNAISGAGGFLLNIFSGFWDGLKEGIGPQITSALEFAFTELPGKILGWLGDLGPIIWGWITGAWDWVINTGFPAYLDVLKTMWVDIPLKILGWLGDLGPTIWGWITGAWDWVKDTAWPAYLETVKFMWTELPLKIVGWLGDLGAAIWGWITGAWTWIKDTAWPAYLETVKFMWTELPGKIVGWLGELGALIWGWITGAWDYVINTAWPAYLGVLQTIWVELPQKIVGWIGDLGGWLWNNVFLPALTWLWDQVTGKFDTLVQFFRDLPGKLKNAVGDMFGFLAENARNAINAIIGIWNNLRVPEITIGPYEIPTSPWTTQRVGPFTFGGWDFPDIPTLATGGIVKALNGGTLAMLGEGRWPEAVLPLPPGMLNGLINLSKLDPSVFKESVVVTSPDIYLQVKIGDKDITDIVDVQIATKNTELARQLVARRS